MLGTLINIFHLIILFIPAAIFFIPVKYIAPIFKYIFLILILTPLIWDLNNDACPLTDIAKYFGSMESAQTQSAFSEVYMKWLYKPILLLFGQKWNKKTINMMSLIHFGINLILLWIYLFYVGKKSLI